MMKMVYVPIPPVFLAFSFLFSTLTALGGEALPSNIPLEGIKELTFLKTGDPLVDWNSKRKWTSSEGQAINATILGVKEDLVALRLENGKTTTLPIARLIEDDRRFISEWAVVSVYFNLGYEPPRSIANMLEPGIFDGAFAKEGKVHKTRNFRFESDAVLTQEVVKDFSRLFEVTYLGVLANPLGLAIAKPEGGKFQVKLFANDADYFRAGGSEDSAGVYLIRERIILVPLSSLGLTRGSSGYKKTREFDPRTLIHETTHALTHQWLAYAPMWFVEGFAEYIAAIPYRDGRLELSRHREGLLELTTRKFGGDPARFALIDPLKFTGMGHREFMGEPEAGRQSIELPRVDPFQITLVSSNMKSSDNNGDSVAGDAKGEADPPATDGVEPATASSGVVPPLPSVPTGPIVVQRYISSMALVYHLFSSGQTEAFRRYLFDFVRFEWDLREYLTTFEETLMSHQTEVEGQIREFDAELKAFNAAVDTYNEDVGRYNKREITTPPALPVEPAIPAPLPVPGILAQPRSASQLSRKAYLKQAWDRHLRFDGALSVESLR